MALAPGFAFVNINARDGHDTRIDNPSRLAFLFKARLSMGYNSDKYFGGISTSSDFSSFSFQKNQGSVSYTTGALRIYFGMRFF
jgi:hypothetical protein